MRRRRTGRAASTVQRRANHDIERLQGTWDALGRVDPMWAILSDPRKVGGRWSLREFFETGAREIDEVFSYLSNLGIAVHPGSALDFGCGIGRLTQPLADRFREVHGVDIAPSMIEAADAHNAHPDRCRYLVNARGDLRVFGDRAFDFIYTNVVLQHMRTSLAEEYIREFVRILKPDGILVFQMLEAHPRSLRQKLQRVIKRVLGRLPAPLVDVARKIRYPTASWRAITSLPVTFVELNGLPRPRVEHVLADAGAHVIACRDMSAANPRSGWASLQYVARRKPPMTDCCETNAC
jgi:2-polyprenyl-3-methyl-5-hydroxy-6-metoxy-1,4-benzoquinol methylase